MLHRTSKNPPTHKHTQRQRVPEPRIRWSCGPSQPVNHGMVAQRRRIGCPNGAPPASPSKLEAGNL